jgi:hypothetical protein
MKIRRQGALDECEARTQGTFVAALRARPRTMHRAVERGLGGRGFILNQVVNHTGSRAAWYGAGERRLSWGRLESQDRKKQQE